MRILGINYEYPPIGGGGGFVTRDIYECMAREGHEVTVVTSGYGALSKEEKVNGVKVARVPVLNRDKLEVASMASMLTYLPSCILQSVRKFDRKTFDIINTHFAVPSGPAGHVLSKVFRIPNVLSIHGGDIYDPSKAMSPHNSRLLRKAVSFLLNAADSVIAQSNDTRQNAYHYYEVKQDIGIIPLGIRKPAFIRKNRADFGFAPEDIIFCTIGRLVKRKNLDDALAVFARLNGGEKYKFIIIGDGPEKEHLQFLADSQKLGNSVRFVGNVNDEEKFQLLDIADIYISTAMHEGFGLVFLEAMECGLPIMCYNRGGQNDFLQNDKTGYVVEIGDVESFAAKAGELAADHNRRSVMGNYNKELVKEYYIESCAGKYLSLFQSMIGQKSA